MAEQMGNIKLPKETQERLKNMGVTIEEARKKVQAVQKLGVDVTELNKQLDWAENARDVLLSEFSEPE